MKASLRKSSLVCMMSLPFIGLTFIGCSGGSPFGKKKDSTSVENEIVESSQPNNPDGENTKTLKVKISSKVQHINNGEVNVLETSDDSKFDMLGNSSIFCNVSLNSGNSTYNIEGDTLHGSLSYESKRIASANGEFEVMGTWQDVFSMDMNSYNVKNTSILTFTKDLVTIEKTCEFKKL